MLAGMDGRFYTAVLRRMANPETLHHRVNYFTGREVRAPLLMASDTETGARQGAALVKAGNCLPAARLINNPTTTPDRASAFTGGVAMQVAPDVVWQGVTCTGPFISDQGKSPRPLPRY